VFADREINPDGWRPGGDFLRGRVWAAQPAAGSGDGSGRGQRQRTKSPAGRRGRGRATYTPTAGVRHLFAAYETGEDKLFAHVKPRNTGARFLEFCR
jgi:hypothetical protein